MRLGTTVLRTCTEPVAFESVMKMRCSKVGQASVDVGVFCLAPAHAGLTGVGDRKLFRKLLHSRCALTESTALPSACAH